MTTNGGQPRIECVLERYGSIHWFDNYLLRLHPALTLGEWIYSALHLCMLSCFSCVQLFVTLWTIACQASLSMGFSRQEYWSGLPCPPPEDLPNPEIKPMSLTSLALAPLASSGKLSSAFQFSPVAQSCPTLCNPMNQSMPGLPVHHRLPEFTQIHVHCVGDAIQPSHPLSSPSPPAPNPCQHQGLFQ